jgi:hypothetical protein
VAFYMNNHWELVPEEWRASLLSLTDDELKVPACFLLPPECCAAVLCNVVVLRVCTLCRPTMFTTISSPPSRLCPSA